MSVQKRKKNYYSHRGDNHKKSKHHSLEPGMTGFLCTCNFREKNCIRDAYKLLNEFADEIYGSNNIKESESTKDNEAGRKEEDDETEEEDNDDDISTALNKEINELKAEYAKPVSARRFQVVDTGVKNVIFVKTTLENPLELVSKIVVELQRTKKQRTRYLLRLLPIEMVCKAYLSDIKCKAEALFEKYFAQEPKTFSIIFSRHSNNSILREEIIEDLAEIISRKNPGNKADLKNPELAVIVEVIRGVCLMSVLPDYYKYKKYNLLELCNTKENKEAEKKPNSDGVSKSQSEVEVKKIDSKENTGTSKEICEKENETRDESTG